MCLLNSIYKTRTIKNILLENNNDNAIICQVYKKKFK